MTAIPTVIDPKTAQGVLVPARTEEEKRLQTLIKRRHPGYEDRESHWEFVLSTYEGGPEWFDGNIYRYLKEGDGEFAQRVKRAYRFNHSREVVDLLNKYLFRQVIARSEDAPLPIKQFWSKTTMNGLSISDFARQISQKTSIFGRIGIVVDSNAEVAGLSLAQAAESDARCYAYIVTPENILDYAFDSKGDLLWILIREFARDDSDPMSSSGEYRERFRLWTRDDWTLYEKRKEGRKIKIVEVGSATHGLGKVPVVLADNVITDEKYCSPGLIDDIAYLDKAVANYLSNLDAIIQDQTFSQLAMPAQNMVPGDEDYNKLIEVGTKRVFLYDGEGGQMPFFLSPDVKQAGLIITAVNKIINEIYHTVGLAGERTKEDNAVGIDNSSGVAKAYDFERVNALLASKADSLQVIENKIVEIVCLWNSEKPPAEALVSYPDDFDTRTLYDEFDIAAKLALVEAPDNVRKEQMRGLAKKLFPQSKKDVMTKIMAEIDSDKWPVNPLDALMNIPQSSPEPSRQGQVTDKTE